MKWVSYTRSISSRIGEENPANTIAEQNTRNGIGVFFYGKKRLTQATECAAAFATDRIER